MLPSLLHFRKCKSTLSLEASHLRMVSSCHHLSRACKSWSMTPACILKKVSVLARHLFMGHWVMAIGPLSRPFQVPKTSSFHDLTWKKWLEMCGSPLWSTTCHRKRPHIASKTTPQVGSRHLSGKGPFKEYLIHHKWCWHHLFSHCLPQNWPHVMYSV